MKTPVRGELVLRDNPAYDKLAHASARSELERVGAPTNRAYARAQACKTMRAAFAVLREHFGSRVLHEAVQRPVGSRALGDLLVLLLRNDSDDGAEVVQIRWSARAAPCLMWTSSGIVVRRHAIARAMQRSVHRDDLIAAANVLRAHLYGLLCVEGDLRKRLVPGQGFELSGRGGALKGEILPVDENDVPGFLVKTWVTVDMSRNPAERERFASPHFVLNATVTTNEPSTDDDEETRTADR